MSSEDFSMYFAKQAAAYAQHRPGYPPELFEFLAEHSPKHEQAWDVATGSGQAARGLAPFFEQVVGTDVSPQQLEYASAPANVRFQEGRAEESGLAENSADLVTVATAAHWFDLPRFFDEVRRVGKPGALLAIWAYDYADVEHEVGELLKYVAKEVLKDDWSDRTLMALAGYSGVPLPFVDLEVPNFTYEARWELGNIFGIVDSWSATQRFTRRSGEHPISPQLRRKLVETWGDTSTCSVKWNVSMRAGYV